MGRRGLWLVLVGTLLAQQAAAREGGAVAKIGQSGESVELERQVDGGTATSSLPLYRSGTVRYFSAGVGLEERSAEYPPFPLKLVFTAGGKPFLSGVSVTIQPAKGPAVIIPREQVEGPWLFVDLTPGLYDISASYGDQVQRLKGVRIDAGKQKVLFLRWKKDLGVAKLPAE